MSRLAMARRWIVLATVGAGGSRLHARGAFSRPHQCGRFERAAGRARELPAQDRL